MPNAFARAASLAAAALLVTLLTGSALAATPLPAAPTAANAVDPDNDTTGIAIAVSAIRLLLPMLQIKLEGLSGEHLVGGGFVSWGAPAAEGIDEKTQLELGGHVGYFPLGTVRRGAGLVAQTMVLQAWGKLQDLESTSYGFSGALFASGRWTFASNALVELQVGGDYLYSWAGLVGSDEGTWQGDFAGLVNLWFGWTF